MSMAPLDDPAILPVVDVETVPHSGRKLTPAEQKKAYQLAAYLLDLRDSGVRLALVSLDKVFGVRVVGKRVDIAPEEK